MHTIIYVSGLGDRYDGLRRRCLAGWRLFGVRVVFVPMRWANNEDYAKKYQRLTGAIDNELRAGQQVTLCGESAGGSMVLIALANYGDKLYRAMTLCGKNNSPEIVSPDVYRKNPAFKQAMYAVPAAVAKLSGQQLNNFISVHAVADYVVPVPESIVPGGQSKTLPMIGHGATALMALTVASWYMVWLATKNLR